jgi:restriction system protein
MSVTNKNYYRLMLGARSVYAKECLAGGFIGGNWGFNTDLSNDLGEDWRVFNKKLIPTFLQANPDKSKVAAGLACGMLHTICKGILIGDIVLCPDGSGDYHYGEITSSYYFVESEVLAHRRRVKWNDRKISRSEMSEKLQRSTGSMGTVSNITKYSNEIEKLINGNTATIITSSDATVEDPSVFAMEKHLEDFLVLNWSSTILGQTHDIISEDGEILGQQYPTDTGPIDILAVSKDRKELLVVELKRGRASDSVVGQIQRYMGYIMSEVAEENQSVRGCIVALDDDIRIKHALKVNPLIDFYRYEVSFKLNKV